jgi:hypothetical protein
LRDAHSEDTNEAIHGISTVDTNSLVMVDPDAGVRKQPGHIYGVGLVGVPPK